MSSVYRWILFLVAVTLIASCGASTPTSTATPAPTDEILPPAQIARYPVPANFSGYNVYTEPPSVDLNATELRELDLRSSDLTDLDLSKSASDLLFADFDSQTQWPSSDRMPTGFDWQKIMELNKDPGLGMRTLHDEGITGKGVGLAIIDQTLLVDHSEYVERLRLYEEPESIDRGMVARMHAPAVASIAVGKTVGVAPEADLYFIGAPSCFSNNDFVCLARSVRRVIEVNETLPPEHKIRVLAIARGWGPRDFGYAEITAALEEAKQAGIFVISSSLSETHSLYFHGLGRDPLSDPNDFWSYQPGIWWQEYFYKQGFPAKMLLVPMDSRTTASPTGTEDYVFYRQGGWSWSIPYLAGMYALAVQVKPEITPEQFWQIALDTGKTIQIDHNAKEYEFGIILDPQALIKAIQAK